MGDERANRKPLTAGQSAAQGDGGTGPSSRGSRHSQVPRKIQLTAWLAARAGHPVSPADFSALQRELAPISEDYLRRLLRDSGAALEPLVEGVRQSSFEELERTLLQLSRSYENSRLTGDRLAQRQCRRLVIIAKNHAKLARRRAEAGSPQRVFRDEVLLWLFTWLENPELFPQWVALRKQASPPASG